MAFCGRDAMYRGDRKVSLARLCGKVQPFRLPSRTGRFFLPCAVIAGSFRRYLPLLTQCFVLIGFIIRSRSSRRPAVKTTGEFAVMRQECAEPHNLNQLKKFVSRTLCQLNDFEEGVFQVTERKLVRCGQRCGIMFCLHGPRSVRLTAIWETVTNSVIFYGSTGEKIHRTAVELEAVPQ